MNLRTLTPLSLLLLTMSASSQTPLHLKTRWTDKVSQTLPHPEYPRPQMVRKDWTNLNGQWDFALAKPTDRAHVRYDHKILVPFPVESALSGLAMHVAEGDQLWYRRSFEARTGGKTLLHFGASDFETTVWVNGHQVGSHKGGYDGFTFDVTEALSAGNPNELVVSVTDPTNAGTQPRGKQVSKPGGIFYTSTSGIWQTVWLETVPEISIQKVVLHPEAGQSRLRADFVVRGSAKGLRYSVQVLEGSNVIAEESASDDASTTVQVPFPKLWSPESPHLYNLKLAIKNGAGKVLDTVDSYTAFRDVRVGPDRAGITRILLNDEPCFMVGPLDQGFWPDGIYTPPTDEALKYDIEITKRLGFNMIRKHVKVEPDRWYYWCDKLGILVWQDMPSGDGFIGPRDPDLKRTPASATEYETELKAMIDGLRNHPSIVTWVPFNEGWGQFDTARITDLIREYDPTRIVDSTTGWSDRGVGDMIDWHVYPGPGSPMPEIKRAAVLGEFGGLGLPTPGHMWQKENWGYQSFKTPTELTDACVGLFERLRFLISSPGLSAAVYTQTTDVETEANGFMTYDREILKMDEKRIHSAVRALFEPPLILLPIVPTSETQAQTWQYTTSKPDSAWSTVKFDDSHWQRGLGGFGTSSTPGAIVGTEWNTDDIWLRRSIEVPSLDKGTQLFIRMHHDDDADVYIDGKLAVKASGYLTSYIYFKVPQSIADKVGSGQHTVAVHCHQNKGGQFIDIGVFRTQ